MTSFFDTAIERVLGKEGGYVNDSRDSGGETNWGITVAVARANGYLGPMIDMTREQAKAIYRSQYWQINRLDDIARHSYPIAYELFDTGVNIGTGTAARWLQRSLNVLNAGGSHWPDLVVDGQVGPRTVFAFAQYLGRRARDGETVMLRALNALQGAHYIGLAEHRPKDEAFVYGWLLNRVG